MHLWRAFISRSNGQSNGKEDTTQIKVLVCNILTVTNENECRDPLLIKDKMAIKPKRNKTKRYTQFSLQKLLLSWILVQYTSTEFHYNLINGGCLANTTPGYSFFSISNLLQVRPWTNPLPSSIHIDKDPNYWFSASSVWCYLWETLIIQAISPIDKRDLHNARWTLSKLHNRFRLSQPM